MTSVATPAHTAEISTTQLYDLSALNELKKPNGQFSFLNDEVVAKLNTVYRMRKKGSTQGMQEVTYKLPTTKSYAGPLGYGRLYAPPHSLEHLQSECRSTLCSKLYHDLDMVNAQPVMLAQLAAKEYQMELDALNDYIANRDTWLASINPCRETAKEEVIKVIYGGQPPAGQPALTRLYDEIQRFAKVLSQDPVHHALWAAVQRQKGADKSKNALGAFLSFIGQTCERKCMLAMKQAAEEEGWTVDVLAYDGIQVRRRDGHDITEDFLHTLEAAVHAATGIIVQIKEKVFTPFAVANQPQDEIAPGVPRVAYEEMKAVFEEQNFYLTTGDRFVSVNPDTGALLSMDLPHAKQVYFSKFYFKTDNPLKPIPFFPLWLSDPTRREIDVIDMKPSTNPRVYSPPLRWAYQRAERPSDEEAASIIAFYEDYLNRLIPDPIMRATYLEWKAHILQQPFKNSKTCVVLAGQKGCGKDTDGDFMTEYIIGSHLTQNYDSNDQFWEKFDTGRMNKLFVKLEEADGVLNKKHENDFKARITTDNVTFRPLHTKEITCPNYTRYLLTTNDYNPVALDAEERRFLIISCGGDLKGNMEYWRTFRQKMFNPTAGRVIGDWLCEQTIGEFPRVLPKSKLAQLIIDATMTAHERFLRSDIWDGSDVGATELFHLYRSYCIDNCYSPITTVRQLGIKFNEYIAQGYLERVEARAGTIYRRLRPLPGQTGVAGGGGF